MEVDNLIPLRGYRKGPKYSMRGKNSKAKGYTTEGKWMFKNKPLTEMKEKKVSEKLYHHVGGGTTGFFIMGMVAISRVINFPRELKKIIKDSCTDWKKCSFMWMTRG